MTTGTKTNKMELDYFGTSQDDAVAVLDVQRDLIIGWNEDRGGLELNIGRTLEAIAANGLLIAAADDIDGQERDWDEAADGRTTEVSRFAADALPEVHRNKISDWRKMARGFDNLESHDVDTSGFAVSAFLSLDEKADDHMSTMVDVVNEVMAANAGTLTAAEFKKAGIAAGIVRETAATKKAKQPKPTKTEAPRIPVLTPLASLIPAMRDAVELEVKYTKGQRQSFAAAAALLITLAGDEYTA